MSACALVGDLSVEPCKTLCLAGGLAVGLVVALEAFSSGPK